VARVRRPLLQPGRSSFCTTLLRICTGTGSLYCALKLLTLPASLTCRGKLFHWSTARTLKKPRRNPWPTHEMRTKNLNSYVPVPVQLCTGCWYCMLTYVLQVLACYTPGIGWRGAGCLSNIISFIWSRQKNYVATQHCKKFVKLPFCRGVALATVNHYGEIGLSFVYEYQ
jgi:hypothetical protein